jgi:hypothetical protein
MHKKHRFIHHTVIPAEERIHSILPCLPSGSSSEALAKVEALAKGRACTQGASPMMGNKKAPAGFRRKKEDGSRGFSTFTLEPSYTKST